MTITEIVQVFGARRAGRGRWIARCPNHDDRTPSLHIAEGKQGVLLKCFQCDNRDILAKVGLRYKDLFYASRDLPSAQLREIYHQRRLEEQAKQQQRAHDIKNVMDAVEFGAGPRRKTQFERDIEAAYR